MAWVMVGAGSVATLQAVGGIQQAEITRAQGRLKEQIDGMNADLVDRQADLELGNGEAQAARYQGVIDSTVAEQRAGYAAAGVDVNYGTAAEVQKETKLTGALNLLDIQKQAREKALGLRTQARGMRLGIGMERMATDATADAQAFSGVVSGAGTALSGYGKTR